jgi:hypothetical protein
MHFSRDITGRQLAITAVAIAAAFVVFAVPLHAGPLADSSDRLRVEVLTTGRNIGIAAIVFGGLGLMFENVRQSHLSALMWLIIGGSFVWGATAIVTTIIT